MERRVQFYVILLLVLLLVYFLCVPKSFHGGEKHSDPPTSVFEAFSHQDNFDFTNFNNNTGVDDLIVPNIVHYVRFKKKSWSFVEYICLRSAYIQQKPDYIFIHTDVDVFRGKYWNWIQEEADLKSRIRIFHIEMPTEIFGTPIKDIWRLNHGSDFTRILALMKYGGIYLDNDVYVVNNLDKYRKYEMTVSWPNNDTLGNMVFMAHKNARFLRLWLDNYRDYRKDKWYYNAGDGPVKEILMKHPELVHRVEKRLGSTFRMREMYQENSHVYDWRKNLDTVHLLINHRHYLDLFFKDYRYFNEHNIQHYPFNFGEMARLVLNSRPVSNNNSFLKNTGTFSTVTFESLV